MARPIRRFAAHHRRPCASRDLPDLRWRLPANEGRGYVSAQDPSPRNPPRPPAGQEKPFMFQMVYAVRDQMGKPYPELEESAGRVAQGVQAEEDRFRQDPRPRLQATRRRRSRRPGASGTANWMAQLAFHLYETFGLPLDFMMDAARDQGTRFDLSGFEQARAEEQARARASWKGGAEEHGKPGLAGRCQRPFLKAIASFIAAIARCSPS